METKWITWARHLQAIAQNGLTFSKDPYDRERFEQIRTLVAEIIASYTMVDMEQVIQLLQGEKGYATPKMDVRGAVFCENRILLVREKSDGLWTLPGGYADVGDSPSEAVVREIHEESGFETKVCKLVALYDRNKHGHPPMMFHVYKAFFLCEIVGGSASPSLETTEVEFFSQEALPDLSIARVTARQIARLFEHHMNRALPTEFD